MQSFTLSMGRLHLLEEKNSDRCTTKKNRVQPHLWLDGSVPRANIPFSDLRLRIHLARYAALLFLTCKKLTRELTVFGSV